MAMYFGIKLTSEVIRYHVSMKSQKKKLHSEITFQWFSGVEQYTEVNLKADSDLTIICNREVYCQSFSQGQNVSENITPLDVFIAYWKAI